MQPLNSRPGGAAEAEPDLIRSLWNDIRRHLEDRKAQLFEEIGNYPPPIPACDQQFNHLLEERARISRELNRVAALCQRGPPKAIATRRSSRTSVVAGLR